MVIRERKRPTGYGCSVGEEGYVDLKVGEWDKPFVIK